MTETNGRLEALLSRVPEAQRQAVAGLIAEYGPALLDLAVAEAWAYIRRIQAGDLEAVREVLLRGNSEAFLTMVRANTARWQGVAEAEAARMKLAREIALRVAPLVLTILLAVVGL